MTDDQPPSILDRMVRSGISETRAREHIAAGAVRVDGTAVSDPDAPAGGRWVIGPG